MPAPDKYLDADLHQLYKQQIDHYATNDELIYAPVGPPGILEHEHSTLYHHQQQQKINANFGTVIPRNYT